MSADRAAAELSRRAGDRAAAKTPAEQPARKPAMAGFRALFRRTSRSELREPTTTANQGDRLRTELPPHLDARGMIGIRGVHERHDESGIEQKAPRHRQPRRSRSQSASV